MKVASTEDGKLTKTEANRQCLVADGVARRARRCMKCWMTVSAMYRCTYQRCQSDYF